MSKTVLFIDTETTGLPEKNRLKRSAFYEPQFYNQYNNARMIEIACVLYEVDESAKEMFQVGAYSSLVLFNDVNKAETIHSEIHGIRASHLKKHGKTMDEVLDNVMSMVEQCDVLVGHNIEFDRNILLAECFRLAAGDGAVHFTRQKSEQYKRYCEIISEKRTICTMRIAYEKLQLSKFPKLIELTQLLSSDDTSAPCQSHRALDDVMLTVTCFKNLLNKYIQQI